MAELQVQRGQMLTDEPSQAQKRSQQQDRSLEAGSPNDLLREPAQASKGAGDAESGGGAKETWARTRRASACFIRLRSEEVGLLCHMRKKMEMVLVPLHL